MGTLRLKVKTTVWSLGVGLLLAGLLGGCTEPFVKVTVEVDRCQAGGGMPIDELPQPGGCFTGSFYNGQANGFWHMQLNRVIGPSENFNCVGATSKKCPSPPGTCTGGNCKSRYYPLTATTGNCNCGCVY